MTADDSSPNGDGHGAIGPWQPWFERSKELAAWVIAHLVIRRDVHGRYFLKDGKPSPFVAKDLTDGMILAHFRARDITDVIGLHTTAWMPVEGAPGGGVSLCRQAQADIDHHGDGPAPEANLAAAVAWHDRLVDRGFRPLLLDSNGRGGYRLAVIFDEPITARHARQLMRWVMRDWEELGLAERPEIFPKQDEITAPGGARPCGNWLRLPGRHHERDHWTRAYSGGEWLEGDDAVDAILDYTGDSPQLIPDDAVRFEPETKVAGDAGPTIRTDERLTGDAALAQEALGWLKPGVEDANGREYGSDYDHWLRVGMACHDLGDVGLALWIGWSRQWADKFDEEVCVYKWGTFRREGEERIRLGTLLKYATAAGRPGPWRPGSDGADGHHANGRGHAASAPDADIEDADILDRWPKVDRKAFHGLAGDIVALADPHTEADPVAVLFQLLTAFGNMIGRTVHFRVGATHHFLNLFTALIGATAIGRKGTSLDIILWLLALTDFAWSKDRIQGGLVSGEGLIHHVRDETWGEREVKDPATRAMVREQYLIDAGIGDKRLLVVETEMGRMLKAMNKPENTLSDVSRQAWDTGQLRTMGKIKASKATGAHVSMICHATSADIRKHLTETDSANGFANRFWWPCSRRSKLLPEGGNLESVNWAPVQDRLLKAARFASQRDATGGYRRMTRDPAASKAWHAIYEELSGARPGLIGKILSRAEPQVMRAACLYAVLDCSEHVRIPHLEAAVAAWEYNEASARLVFGDGMGDPDAEKVLKALKEQPAGLTRTQISADVFRRNMKADTLVALLSDLLTQALIHRKTDASTGGRSAERWFIGSGS